MSVTPKLRAAVFKADDHTCVYCGQPGTCIDHFIPESRFGPDVLDNLFTCCRSCNSVKGDRSIDRAGLALRYGRFLYVSVMLDSTPRPPFLRLPSKPRTRGGFGSEAAERRWWSQQQHLLEKLLQIEG